MDNLISTTSTVWGQNASSIDGAVDFPHSHPEGDPDFELGLQRLKFVAYGIVGSLVIALGIFGNVVNLIVLTRPSLKGVTFVYLRWLAISDLLSLIVSTTSLLRLQGIQQRTYAWALYYSHAELPLVNAFMASSVFLVITVTIDRYFSVCHPARYKQIHTFRLARRSIMAAYVIAFVLYIPTCFQNVPTVVETQLNETATISTSHVDYVPKQDPRVFEHPGFRIYLHVKEIFVRLGPVLLLATLNLLIIFTFRNAVKNRRKLLGNPIHANVTTHANHQRSFNNKKFREEGRLVALLAGIVIMFCTCMTPASLLTLLNSDAKEYSYGFQLFRAVANVLELANYSMNFYVYCLCSSDFRTTFILLFPCSAIRHNSSMYDSSLTPHSQNKNNSQLEDRDGTKI